MDLIIKPFEGVGPINFGMTRESIIKAVGEQPDTFQRFPPPALPTDNFGEAGFLAHYDSEGCRDLEFDLNGSWWTRLRFRGYYISKTPYETFLSMARDEDPDIAFDEDGFTSTLLGIAMQLDPDQVEDGMAPDKIRVVYVAVMGQGSMFIDPLEL
jgi:hypothetical protein